MNQITTFIFDVDGVLTNGDVHVTPTGEMLRIMNIRDGFAMKAAVESGYNVCIISGGFNEGVRIRLRNLGITDIHLSTPDKVQTFKEYIELYNISVSYTHLDVYKRQRKGKLKSPVAKATGLF